MNLNSFETNRLLHPAYVPWVINSILLAVLIWQTIHLFYQQSQSGNQAELLQNIPFNQSEHSIANIAAMHLFGLSEVEQVPETRLNIMLSSIFQSNQPENSRVLISVGSDTGSYKIGDVLPGEAVIEDILSDRVLLRYQGQLQVLLLPRDFLNLDERFLL